MKETSIVVNFADLLASISVETKLVPHLTALFEEPEGLVYEDDFNRFTKLTVNLTQIEVDYVPLYKPVRLNLSTERLKITCSIIPNSPSFALKLTLRNLVAALADSTGSLSSEPESPSQLVNVLAVSTLSVSVRFSDGLISPKFELEASNDEVVIETCSDSLAAMMNLLQYIGRSGDFPTEIPPPAMSQPQPKTAGSPTALSMDILASLEENEFVHSSGNRDLANRSNLRFVSIDDLDSGLDDGEYVQADLGSPPLSEDAGVTDDAVQVFDDEQSFMISPDHFALYGGPPSDEQDTDSRPLLQVKVKELNIIWRLFDGSDWQHPIAQEGELDFEENAETEMSTSQTDEDEDLFLESIPSHFSAKTPRTPRPKHHETRSAECRVEFRFSKINVEFEKYSDDSQRASKLSIFVRDVEVIDNVQTSLWRKFLSPLRPNSDDLPRETRSDMLTFEMINVRPNPSLPAQEEIRLKAQLLPLRLHIDQDALMFLIDFFNDGRSEPTSQSPSTSPSDESFFQLCHIYPISMKIDYKPKHVDYKSLKGGNFVEIMNFFPLDGAEMTLRDVRVTGVKGWSRLGEIVLGKWLPHVSTQVPRVVSGVSGVRSLVNLGSGIANLILLPIEQYRKDGRIVRGLQKGAKSFAKAATMETLRLGTRVAVGTQVLLEQADTLISAERDSGPARERRSKLSEQPKDLKEGIELGYRSISKNLGYAAKTILAVPMEVRQSSGTAQSVIRAVPVAVLKPMIGATEMVSKTLMGLQNSIDPNKRLQMEDKYKA
ncbi:ATG C terminal domain-containing protein [Zopfochytrium polystomum]|nr:ATG C terminal domain-containing protein [Zopfochytrium polystomum]